jgi:eukaryotic-like serine/threonine-protein kinase
MNKDPEITRTMKPAESLIGSRISKYQVLEKVGEGGMGVVYKAMDTRLERCVALKVIGPQSIQGEEARSRFLREAKAGAALAHPNICTLYEADESDGTLFIAMELIEGVPLKQKIQQRPLPVEEALDIAAQVAAGLKAAHQKGIIHRDIKPGNILIGPEGGAKILDFGLAQFLGVSQLTASGTALGTPAYMSPEQLQGAKVDERTDIWALGILLYEMLAGRPPFASQSGQGLAYQIIHQEPEPLTAVRTGVPIEIDHIVAKAMAKDPGERYQHVDEMLVDLQVLKKRLSTLAYSRTTLIPGQKPQRLRRQALPWAVASFAVLATLFVWHPWKQGQPRAPAQVTRFVVPLPEGDSFQGVGGAGSAIDVSPDGTQVIYAARRGKVRQLFRRSISDLEPQPIPETQGAVAPILSHDLSWVTFALGRQVKRVHTLAGTSSVVGTTNDSMQLFDVDIAFFGGCWLSPNDLLVGECTRGLRLFSLESGQKKEITDVFNKPKEGEKQHQFPQVLPGGKWVLFTIWNSAQDSSIAVRSLVTGEQKVLLKPGTYARYSPSGHIVYGWEGNLLAAPFDLKKMEVTGSPVKVIEGVMMQEARGAAHFSISENGSLAYIPGPYIRYSLHLAWVDLQGKSEKLDFPSPQQFGVRLSPDGKMALVTYQPDGASNPEIWVYELDRGVSRPVTDQKSLSYWPIWTPDGSGIVFCSGPSNKDLNLYRVPADGSGAPEKLTAMADIYKMAYSWVPGGKALAFQQGNESGDIWMLPLEGDRRPYPVLQAVYSEIHPAISPDGRWLAYASNESGRYEVKVRPLSGKGEVVQASGEGGWEPLWSHDGKTLFYRDFRADKLMAVPVEPGPALKVGRSRVVFERQWLLEGTLFGRNYDISPDDKRFLMVEAVPPPAPPTKYVVVLNWAEEMKRLVPGK